MITALFLARSSDYGSLTLVNGIPDSGSIDTYFEEVPIVQEKADIKESTQESDQGQLKDISIRANIHRESLYYNEFSNKHVLVYAETANGEKHFLGTVDNPLTFAFTRDTGAGNSDSRETTLLMGQKVAL